VGFLPFCLFAFAGGSLQRKVFTAGPAIAALVGGTGSCFFVLYTNSDSFGELFLGDYGWALGGLSRLGVALEFGVFAFAGLWVGCLRRWTLLVVCLWCACFVSGLLGLPLCGAALTFFAAAKKVSKESGLKPPAHKRVSRTVAVVVHLESVFSRTPSL
jgi:hypothetical protein